MMRVRILPRADQDIDDVVLYFVKKRIPRTAQRFLDAVDKMLQVLADNPLMASMWDSAHAALQQTRFWSVKGIPKYIVFFRICQGQILEVMRVLHSSRDLEPLLQAGLDD